jgi:hypothetical protein
MFALSFPLFALSGICALACAWSWADRGMEPHHPGAVASFFSVVVRHVLPLSFSFRLDRSHTDRGGPRDWWIAARIARTIGPVTSSSASSKERRKVAGL